MAQRSFKLDDDLDARLLREAERQGRSVSNLIVWAITRELDPKSNWVPHKGFPAGSVGGTLPPPSKRFDGPNPNTHRDYAGVDGPAGGTPLPKIAPRRQAK